ERLVPDVRLTDEGETDVALLQGHRLGVDELQIEPGRLAAVGRSGFQQGRRTHVLVAELHAVFPVRTVRRRRHAPLRRTVLVHDRQTGLHHVGGEGGVPEDLLGDIALRRYRARLGEGHALRLRRGIFLYPVEIFDDRIDRRRAVDVAATFDRRADRTTAFHPDAPFVDRKPVRQSLVAVA